MSLTAEKNTKDPHLTEDWWKRWEGVEHPELWAKNNGGEFTTGPLADTKEAKETSRKLYRELLTEQEQNRK